GDHVVDERRLSRRLRAEDLDDPAPWQAADPEREVERERARRDRADRHLRSVAHLHDRSFAELALDLAERGVESFSAIQRDQPPRPNDSRISYCAPPGRSREW